MLKEIKKTLEAIRQSCTEIRAIAGGPQCRLKTLSQKEAFNPGKDKRRAANPR